MPDESDQAFLDKIRPKLYAARARRPPPSTDTKILTSWNGLMISAFARAGLALSRQDYLDRAARAADTVLERHFADGNLRRTGRHAGLLEDHAFLAAGLVDLFEATGEPRRLQTAVRLHEALARRFADPAGGFYRTPADHEALLAREKPAYDGAEPTGNSLRRAPTASRRRSCSALLARCSPARRRRWARCCSRSISSSARRARWCW